MNIKYALYRFNHLFSVSRKDYPMVNAHETTIGNTFLGLTRFVSTDKGRNQLILHLFGLWVVFGWAGNCITPALHFQLHKSKDSIIGLLEITLRFRQWQETRIYIRLGQHLYRDYDWTTHERTNPYYAWCIEIDSQHFVRLAQKLSYPLGYSLCEPTWLKKHGLVDYRVESEAPSGDYTASGRILFVHNDHVMM